MITYILVRLVDLYSLLIFVYIMLSWIPTKTGWLADINNVFAMICEPYLRLFRKVIPPVGMMDFSPIVAIIALQVITRLIYIIL